MRYRLVALCALLFCGALSLKGQGPDQKYVTIYNLIQQGDTLRANDQLRLAAERYAEAQSLLREYPAQYPGWNENVVGYRLRYLAAQLKELAQYLPTPPPPAAAATNAAAPPGLASERPPIPGTAPIPAAEPAPPPPATAAMQAEIERLTQLNAELESKLKEALSVQPAAVDPRELTKAEARVQELQKELDLLKVTMEQEKFKSAAAVEAAASEQEKVLIEDLKQRLIRQNTLVKTLQTENAQLKLELVLATNAPPRTTPSAEPSEELSVAQATISALQATNVALRTEKIMLETRVDDLVREGSGASSTRVKELEAQRDDLREKLAVATRQLERRKSLPAAWRTDDLAQQLESVLAKLDVFEARAVPYSPEELALFKQSATNAPAATANAEKITVRELPPGTGPLIAEAMQASKDKRYGRAEELFLQVLRQDENHIFTLDNLAAVQIKQKDLGSAEKTLRRALDLDPKNPSTLFLWGHLKYEQANYDEALDALSLAAKSNPEDPWTQFFLGQTLIQQGNRKAAETALRKALQLNPEWPEAHHALALVYATQEPPFKELAQWHYNKAVGSGFAGDPALRKLISTEPQ